MKWDHGEAPVILIRREISKNGRKATLPIYPPLVPILRQMQADAEGGGRWYDNERGRAGFLFSVVPSHHTHAREIAAAKIPKQDPGGVYGQASFHSLRKSFVTHLSSLDTPQVAWKYLCRHSQGVTDKYHQPFAATLTKYVSALPNILPPDSGGNPPNGDNLPTGPGFCVDEPPPVADTTSGVRNPTRTTAPSGTQTPAANATSGLSASDDGGGWAPLPNGAGGNRTPRLKKEGGTGSGGLDSDLIQTALGLLCEAHRLIRLAQSIREGSADHVCPRQPQQSREPSSD